MLGVLQRYEHLSSLIVVSHAVVISSMLGVQRAVEHAEIVPLEVDLGAGTVEPIFAEPDLQLG